MGKIIWIVIVLILVVGGFYLFNGDDSEVGTEEGTRSPGAVVPATGNEGVDEVIVEEIDSGDTGAGDEDEVVGTDNALQIYIVNVSSSGFSPSSLEIRQEETVQFVNVGTRGVWPASDVHPTHTVYPGSDIGKCFDGSDAGLIFDACGDLGEGESYSFTFTEKGTWRYHDHLKSSNNGVIIVN